MEHVRPAGMAKSSDSGRVGGSFRENIVNMTVMFPRGVRPLRGEPFGADLGWSLESPRFWRRIERGPLRTNRPLADFR